jgi:hypothetical protein
VDRAGENCGQQRESVTNVGLPRVATSPSWRAAALHNARRATRTDRCERARHDRC